MRTVTLSPDDQGQVEVLPAAAADWCGAEMARLDALVADWDSGAVFVRGDPPVPLADAGLTLAQVEAAVAPALAAFDAVYVGPAGRRQPFPGVRAWGHGGAALVAEATDAGLVQAVWLTPGGVDPGEIDRWAHTLTHLPRAAHLILADWNASRVVPLASPAAVADYLRSSC